MSSCQSWYQQLETHWWPYEKSLDAPTLLSLPSCVAYIVVSWDPLVEEFEESGESEMTRSSRLRLGKRCDITTTRNGLGSDFTDLVELVESRYKSGRLGRFDLVDIGRVEAESTPSWSTILWTRDDRRVKKGKTHIWASSVFLSSSALAREPMSPSSFASFLRRRDHRRRRSLLQVSLSFSRSLF